MMDAPRPRGFKPDPIGDPFGFRKETMEMFRQLFEDGKIVINTRPVILGIHEPLRITSLIPDIDRHDET
jgi:phage FluMu gp28-like protein